MAIPHEYTIQAARPNHIPFLNDIELAAAAIFPPGSIPAHILSERVPEGTLMEAMRDGGLWVALDADAKPVGYGLLQCVDGAALLAQLDVHPDHGRRGLGAALVRRIIETARSRGADALYLTTFAQVPWNAPFYTRLGFVALTEADQPRWVREILAEERDRGLENRTAMRLTLTDN